MKDYVFPIVLLESISLYLKNALCCPGLIDVFQYFFNFGPIWNTNTLIGMLLLK